MSTSGALPAQAADMLVKLALTRVSNNGPYNDGYADNLSLVLQQPLFLAFRRR